jgi:4-diphosphocytidyl-2-C-methyl-D-erythritol kinase
MLVFPNAKINIGLHIVEKRNDGYHNIESIFYPIPLQDALEAVIEPLQNDAVTNQSISLVTTGFEIVGNSNDNLITKAYYLLQKDYPQLQGLHVHLHKAIPMGAGLGGGSADCAFFIRLLNQLYALQLTPVQLHNYAQQLGSDCAFFIANTPAYATQRGEVLMPIALNLSGYYLVLVKPNIHVSTAQAYAGVSPKPSVMPLTTLIQQPMEQWKDSISNDFEAAIFATHPVLNDIKTQLYTQGAVYAAMSGSGATVYGLFKNEVDLEQLFAPHFYYATTL